MVHIFWEFLLGMLTASYILPILDKVGEVILTYLEMVKGKITVKITELGCQITKLQDASREDESSPKRIIGFVSSEEEEDSDDKV